MIKSRCGCREKLCSVLPARAQGYMWSLAFSTSQNGFSLASMYRKMQRVDSPVLLVIQDTYNNVCFNKTFYDNFCVILKLETKIF